MLCAKFAYDVRHLARVACKCCAHLTSEERATRDVTYDPSVQQHRDFSNTSSRTSVTSDMVNVIAEQIADRIGASKVITYSPQKTTRDRRGYARCTQVHHYRYQNYWYLFANDLYACYENWRKLVPFPFIIDINQIIYKYLILQYPGRQHA
jgi:hypothetical protein